MAYPVPDLAGRLAEPLAKAVAEAAARRGTAVAEADLPALAETVAGAIAADPALGHAVNAEPWYRSRVTWGAIIAALAPVIGIVAGREIGAEEQSLLADAAMAAAGLAGAALALYGRWVARVPLGR